jgi:hypothetical protein
VESGRSGGRGGTIGCFTERNDEVITAGRLGFVVSDGRVAACRPDGMIVMLTVFHKTRQHDQRQIDRAVRAQQACEREHRRPAEQTYERQA